MIFYFSATGNSKYVAKKINEYYDFQMIDMLQAIKGNNFDYNLKDEELIFIVFPNYYSTLPKQVIEFLEKVKFENNSIKICGVVTCGGSAGDTDRIFKRIIKKKALETSGYYQVVMPDFYIALFKPPLPEEQIMILKRADKTVKDIVDNVNYQFRKSYNSSILQRLGGIFARLIYKKGRPTKKFFVKEVCISCGKCEKVCVDEIIKYDENQRPIWTEKRCSHCMACINHCPTVAIEYGKKTAGKGRYTTKSK